MSQTHANHPDDMPAATHAPGEEVLGGDSHDDGHGHNPHLAHHFSSMQQQFASAKLGMWVFLATEILMFGGLFCAYAFYRGNHPELYEFSHYFLDTNLGFTNTIILLASSFTMAWGVRAAMLGQQQLLKILLVLTLCGGVGFMVIKTFEYASKYNHNLWFGPGNAFYFSGDQHANPDDLDHALDYREKKLHNKAGDGDKTHKHQPDDHGTDHGDKPAPALEHPEPTALAISSTDTEAKAEAQADSVWPPKPASVDQYQAPPVATGPSGVASTFFDEPEATKLQVTKKVPANFDDLPPLDQERAHLFFQIYFLMTGLHGLHVLIGMGLIGWVLYRATRGAFGPQNFTAVDIVGLYWHLVDLIWIFLFPLLYLIH